MNTPQSQRSPLPIQRGPVTLPNPARDLATDHRRMPNPPLQDRSHLSANRPVDSKKVMKVEGTKRPRVPHSPDNGFSRRKVPERQKREPKKQGTSNDKGPSPGGKPVRAPQLELDYSLEMRPSGPARVSAPQLELDYSLKMKSSGRDD